MKGTLVMFLTQTNLHANIRTYENEGVWKKPLDLFVAVPVRTPMPIFTIILIHKIVQCSYVFILRSIYHALGFYYTKIIHR